MIKHGLVFTFVMSGILVGCGKNDSTEQTTQLTPPPADFISPYRFIKFRLEAASDILKTAANANGSIITTTAQYKTRYDSTDGVITYSEIYLLETAPCSQTEPFDPIAVLNAVAVNPKNLEERDRMTHLATYYDHQEKLKVSITCEQDGTPIVVRFSNKYYQG
ncbi:hypothetical protein H5201_09595 [Pseudoalteromonas sp. SG43-6]|uniref:hypothetical protein n=1 Tax=Pseudoalteromonas sp. SG43-6 TaxID=2760967 RepID=UPI00160027AB|nr:hypothetical protein [Pseudoalteromonas sp. SG43-6]MBB1434561.1 hypothetical protein [Pseudoalteromonas sp. SG43-6]